MSAQRRLRSANTPTEPAIPDISSGNFSVLMFTPIPTITDSAMPLSKSLIASVSIPETFLPEQKMSFTHFIPA